MADNSFGAGDTRSVSRALYVCADAKKLIATMRGMIPAGMILYHLVQSEIDAAIDWYERMIEQRKPIAAELASAGYLKPLRCNPRWLKLAKMMNLPG